MHAACDISVVIPVFNEVESLAELHEEIVRAMEPMGQSFEVVYVDDHSGDGSLHLLLQLREQDHRIRVVRFRRNFGQTSALNAGFLLSRGEIVVTLDGDLQNDPADIPALVRDIREGYDISAGWRKDRRDGFWLRRLPSVLANRLIAAVTQTPIHDTGCTLKAFRRELVRNLPIYAEQHRFLPAMSAGSGARVTERVVNHRPRRYGKSKYGLGRALRVLLDLLSIKMIAQFSHRPLHYFGLISIHFAAFTLVLLCLTTINYRTGSLMPQWEQYVAFTSILFFLPAVYFVLLGLLAELAITASGMHRRKVLDRLLAELH
jgi:glycosyltransferase involved in cell wall biosynthesis